MGGHGTELEVRSTHHIKGIYSNKKKHNEKFGKTQKKLPDLATSGYNESYAKKPVGGFASDSDDEEKKAAQEQEKMLKKYARIG